MDKNVTHKVLLYGNSILIVGLLSRLQNFAEWEATRINLDDMTSLPEADFVVVDLRDARTSRILPRLASSPDVSLVGLDALTDTVTVLAGKPRQAPYMQEMLDVLKEAM